ncbi:DMT family transporter [Comamonas sp.]|uniref:DMT family transporter n=1 Tax=Comamonas sp. TaxID=34028 RepID=UPI00289EA0B5|nr:DMT family transporter [Comamonas sp.]
MSRYPEPAQMAAASIDHPSQAASRSPGDAFGGVLPFVLGSALLGSIGIFVHMALAGALTATWFRCAFGLLGLTAWLLWRRQLRFLRLDRSTAVWVLLASVLMVLSWVLFFAAMERISAGVAVVLFHMQPMWVLVLGALCLGERPGRQRVVAVAVAMLGLVLATGVLQQAASPHAAQPQYWWGVGMCLLGAFLTAAVTVMARRLRALPAGVLAWWQCAIGTAVLWMAPATQGWPAWGASWAWLAALGLVHTATAYALIYTGMARLPTGRIAVLQFVYPAVAILVDWQYFGHRLGEWQMVGVVVMGVAIGYAERSGLGMKPPPWTRRWPILNPPQTSAHKDSPPVP